MKILTFDLEDWFHILDNDSTKSEIQWERYESRIHRNVDRLLQMLELRNQKATFFCLSWLANKHPDIVLRISSLGYEIASHSHMHQLVYKQSRKEFQSDLDTSVKCLEDLTGKKIRAFRAPGFSFTKSNPWVYDALKENGIEIDCSIFPAKRGHGGFPEFGASQPVLLKSNGSLLKEFPVNIFSAGPFRLVFSGGGYFRFFPYWMIKTFMKKAPYVMSYFHPRDFDPEQPVLDGLTVMRRFKSYYGLSTSFAKLEKLLDAFKFTDISSAEKEFDWQNAKIVYLDDSDRRRKNH